MTKKRELPPALALFFRNRLHAITHGAVRIPETLEFDKVYHLSDEEEQNQISFRIMAPSTPYLDYFKPYEEHRGHARGSFHGRILATGQELALENYQGEWGLPFYRDDPARTATEQTAIRQHNQLVTLVLRQKGLV